MNHTIKGRDPVGTGQADGLSPWNAERAELHRQGAKAAARGEPSDTNPLSDPCNKPLATGESEDKWLQRSDAWAQGHDAQMAGQNAAPIASKKGSR